MIEQIKTRFKLKKKFKNYLKKIEPFNQKTWTSRSKDISLIKILIKTQLIDIQKNKCVYCGLDLHETSNEEIEHIAPKKEYPEFMFHTKNLALACHRCNFSKKGRFDTISHYNSLYHLCNFKIVHPYFDDPLDHLGWIDKRTEILIFGKTPKGKQTIELFGLNEEQQTIARAKIKIFEQFKLSQENEKIIENILSIFMDLFSF